MHRYTGKKVKTYGKDRYIIKLDGFRITATNGIKTSVFTVGFKFFTGFTVRPETGPYRLPV